MCEHTCTLYKFLQDNFSEPSGMQILTWIFKIGIFTYFTVYIYNVFKWHANFKYVFLHMELYIYEDLRCHLASHLLKNYSKILRISFSERFIVTILRIVIEYLKVKRLQNAKIWHLCLCQQLIFINHVGYIVYPIQVSFK